MFCWQTSRYKSNEEGATDEESAQNGDGNESVDTPSQNYSIQVTDEPENDEERHTLLSNGSQIDDNGSGNIVVPGDNIDGVTEGVNRTHDGELDRLMLNDDIHDVVVEKSEIYDPNGLQNQTMKVREAQLSKTIVLIILIG